MVDPTNITDFNRTREQLEELLLFCIVVAGKTATIQAKKLEEFLNIKTKYTFPFDKVKRLIKTGKLLERLEKVKLGQYRKIEKSFQQVIKLDVQKCTVEDLEHIYGIGPKTARFFMLHSRPKQRVAVLDTHILKWFNEHLEVKAPKSTPPLKQYKKLEEMFLKYCDTHNYDPATLDLEIWNKYSKNKI